MKRKPSYLSVFVTLQIQRYSTDHNASMIHLNLTIQRTRYCMSSHNIGTHPRACSPWVRCQY